MNRGKRGCKKSEGFETGFSAKISIRWIRCGSFHRQKGWVLVLCKRLDTHNVNGDRTRYPNGILRLFFAWPTGVIVTPPRQTKLILLPGLLCVQFTRPTKKTHPLVSDIESSALLALAELTRDEADSGVPLFIAVRT